MGFVAIFNLDKYPHYKLGVAYLFCHCGGGYHPKREVAIYGDTLQNLPTIA